MTYDDQRDVEGLGSSNLSYKMTLFSQGRGVFEEVNSSHAKTYSKVLGQLNLEELFESTQQEPASPAFPTTVNNRRPRSAARLKKKYVYVWVDLRYDREAGIEILEQPGTNRREHQQHMYTLTYPMTKVA